MERRCLNIACSCDVGQQGDACGDYCQNLPAEPRADICKCGHEKCAQETERELHPTTA